MLKGGRKTNKEFIFRDYQLVQKKANEKQIPE
jgi:hypothetical protein